MKVILISGYKGSGKDTFATLLKEELESKGEDVEILHFADALKDIICDSIGVTREELDFYKNNDFDLSITKGDDSAIVSSVRGMLQRFGTEAMKKKLGNDIWVKIIANKIDSVNTLDYILIPDFRFMNEYKYLVDICGFEVISIRVEDETIKSTDLHSSETEILGFGFDLFINNTEKSIEVFNDKVCKLVSLL